MSVHTIYVPDGWSVEQAWQHIKDHRAAALVTPPRPGRWVNVDNNGRPVK